MYKDPVLHVYIDTYISLFQNGVLNIFQYGDDGKLTEKNSYFITQSGQEGTATLVSGFYSNPLILIEVEDSKYQKYIQVKKLTGTNPTDVLSLYPFILDFTIMENADYFQIIATQINNQSSSSSSSSSNSSSDTFEISALDEPTVPSTVVISTINMNNMSDITQTSTGTDNCGTTVLATQTLVILACPSDSMNKGKISVYYNGTMKLA
jgi:hypothetical protein